MKGKTIIKSGAFLLGMLVMCVFSSCSSDDDNTVPETSSEKLVKFMKTNLYDEQGNVEANVLSTYQTGEYNLTANDGGDVCKYFSSMTGVEAPLMDSYQYEYSSEDGKCKVSIKGTKVAKDGIYATIYIRIPECPEIKILHIGTEAIMNGTNGSSGSDSSIETRPHQIKGFN